MKQKIILAAFAATLILAVSAAGNASAEQQPDGCYEDYQEYLYERPTYGDVIEKETQTRTATSTNYGVTWSAWSAWGPWTDWPDAGPVNDDGRDRGPAPHGSGYSDNSGQNREKWERQYRYVVVGQFENGTEQYGWTEEAPPLEGWELIDERTSERETECPPTTTAPTTTIAETTTTVAETTTTVAETTTTVAETTTTGAPTTTTPATTTVPPVVTPQSLPETGSENLVMAAIAGLLVLAGGGSLILARRR